MLASTPLPFISLPSHPAAPSLLFSPLPHSIFLFSCSVSHDPSLCKTFNLTESVGEGYSLNVTFLIFPPFLCRPLLSSCFIASLSYLLLIVFSFMFLIFPVLWSPFLYFPFLLFPPLHPPLLPHFLLSFSESHLVFPSISYTPFLPSPSSVFASVTPFPFALISSFSFSPFSSSPYFIWLTSSLLSPPLLAFFSSPLITPGVSLGHLPRLLFLRSTRSKAASFFLPPSISLTLARTHTHAHTHTHTH